MSNIGYINDSGGTPRLINGAWIVDGGPFRQVGKAYHLVTDGLGTTWKPVDFLAPADGDFRPPNRSLARDDGSVMGPGWFRMSWTNQNDQAWQWGWNVWVRFWLDGVQQNDIIVNQSAGFVRIYNGSSSPTVQASAWYVNALGHGNGAGQIFTAY